MGSASFGRGAEMPAMFFLFMVVALWSMLAIFYASLAIVYGVMALYKLARALHSHFNDGGE